jgi:hypothetical protein
LSAHKKPNYYWVSKLSFESTTEAEGAVARIPANNITTSLSDILQQDTVTTDLTDIKQYFLLLILDQNIQLLHPNTPGHT